VDFGKLIQAKENISQLNESFQVIEQEIDELDGILNEYDVWESEKNRLLADDIRIVYKRLKDLQREIARQENDRTLAARRKDDLDKELEILDGKKKLTPV